MPLTGTPGYTILAAAAPRRPERALAVAALSAVLLLKPFLGIFDKGAAATFAGIPVLFVYLFIAWAVIIALTAWVMETREAGVDHGDEGSQPADATPTVGQAPAGPQDATANKR